MLPVKRSNKLPRRKRERKRKTKMLLAFWALFILTTAAAVFLFYLECEPKTHAQVHRSASRTARAAGNKQQEKNRTIRPVETVNRNPAIDDYLRRLHFNGTVIVVRDGKIILDKGYGFADFAKKRLNTPESTYYLGSIQKSMIATAVLQLQEKNQLNVKDPVGKYLPGFPNGQSIKLYHLLTHTSGIVGHQEGSGYISPKNLIKDIESRGVKAPIGTWEYNDSNYSVLAYIVQKLTGKPIETYVKNHIFKTAGMEQTGFYQTYSREPNPSAGYKYRNGRLVRPFLLNLSQLYGCGNIYTSAHDLYLFDKALYTGKLISKKSYAQMFTPYKQTYGFGFYVDPGSYSNHGVMPGWNALNSFSRSGRTYVVLLSNIENNIRSFGAVNNHIYSLLNQTAETSPGIGKKKSPSPN